MKKLYRLTQSGVDELNEEHKTLLKQRSPLAERIREARELGDLSENAEYQSAREEQERLEARINEVEHILHNVDLIKKPKADGQVRLGSNVELKGRDGNIKEFQVVGTMEADPTLGKISDESPIGKELIGKKVGETVQIKNPSDTITYQLVSIS